MNKENIKPNIRSFAEKVSKDRSDLDLTIEFQNAMKSRGTYLKGVRVTRSRRGFRFRLDVNLPKWARDHIDGMNAAAEAQELTSRRARGEIV